MKDDVTYMVKVLQRAGQWDAALELLGDRDPELRAEVMVERFSWQFVPIEPDVQLSEVLTARVSYWHKLFELPGGPDVDEAAVYAAHPGAWTSFHWAVIQDNLHQRPDLAKQGYARARELAPDDRFLESFVVRHMAGHVMEDEQDYDKATAMLRRSLNLRSALGARPHTAAAQIALAQHLGDEHPEAVELKAIVAATAEELNLVWLK